MSGAGHWVAVKTGKKEHVRASDRSSTILANYGQVLNRKHAIKDSNLFLN
jgi:hypothetical protein